MNAPQTLLDRLKREGQAPRLANEPPEGLLQRQVHEHADLEKQITDIAIREGTTGPNVVATATPPARKPLTLERALKLAAPHADGIKRTIEIVR